MRTVDVTRWFRELMGLRHKTGAAVKRTRRRYPGLYQSERAKKWADEVSGLPKFSKERGTVIRRIAEKYGVSPDTVRDWVSRIEGAK